jgi:hypothetical protein
LCVAYASRTKNELFSDYSKERRPDSVIYSLQQLSICLRVTPSKTPPLDKRQKSTAALSATQCCRTGCSYNTWKCNNCSKYNCRFYNISEHVRVKVNFRDSLRKFAGHFVLHQKSRQKSRIFSSKKFCSLITSIAKCLLIYFKLAISNTYPNLL